MNQLVTQYVKQFEKSGLSAHSRVIFAVGPGIEFYASLLALMKLNAVPILADPNMGLRKLLTCYRSANPHGMILKIGSHMTSLKFPWAPKILPENMLAINFTTGSTGLAKGVVYTKVMFDAILNSVSKLYEHGPDSVTYSTLPAFGLIDLLLGATVLLKPSSSVTHVFTSPAFLDKIPFLSMPNLKHVVCGGAPPRPEQIPNLPRGARFHVTYGATEALPIASTEFYQFGCLGKPVSGIEVKIIDQEICVSGCSVSQSYYLNQEANQQYKFFLDNQFWHKTGDLGYFDASGQLWSLGRKSEVVHTKQGPLYTVPVEHFYNTYFKTQTALVGIGPVGDQIPVICIEKRRRFPVDPRHQSKIKRHDLAKWAEKNSQTFFQADAGPIIQERFGSVNIQCSTFA